MLFEVNLIKVPPLKDMSGADVFELMVNARHIKGDYWMFEGMVEALVVGVKVVDTGVTEAHGDMSDTNFIDYCMTTVFPGSEEKIKESPRSWTMLSNLGR